MSQAARRALVLGSDSRAFLSVIRSLGRAGIQVHVAWCPPSSIALRSRYVHRVHHIATPAASDHWVAPLLEVCGREHIDLVIPCDDPSALPLYARRAEVEPHVKVALLSQAAFEVVNSKAKTYELGERLGLSVPRQMRITSPAMVADAERELGLPVVVKPDTSFTLAGLTHKRDVRVTRTREELAAAIAHASPAEPVLAQGFFSGAGVGVEMLALDGEILVAFQHRRVHEPLDGGGSSLRVSEPVTPALLDAASRLARALQYTGVGMVEFKVDDATGRWILVEINGRFWGSLPLAVAAGADFPRFLFEMLVDGRREFPRTFRHGLLARNWQRDVEWGLERWRAARRGVSGVKHPVGMLARELPGMLVGRERSDTLTLDDVRPGLAELGAIASRFTTPVASKVRTRVRELPFVRAVAARRAERAWAGARRVLFVCKGNICRSPYAHYHAARADTAGREFRSAGYYPKSGRPTPDNGVAAARALGLELGEHRSSPLDAEAVRWADMIYVFDDENIARLAADYPESRGKVHLLGVHAGPTSVIVDPYSGPLEAFDACYRRIGGIIDALSRSRR